eukprot:12935795-Alexandrium_andersonii.AAC.1
MAWSCGWAFGWGAWWARGVRVGGVGCCGLGRPGACRTWVVLGVVAWEGHAGTCRAWAVFGDVASDMQGLAERG